ncbi:hypothetical protein CISIN_1g035212mg [Citrus sinensis]|uniref:Uncharacterized protein n=1 Tax=Citrus sinensis TaxID=2711 RepID=A0A067FM78_CITSI|nr:hypothetical protein CISIN_1g035212mg [Citrus sinensis]
MRMANHTIVTTFMSTTSIGLTSMPPVECCHYDHTNSETTLLLNLILLQLSPSPLPHELAQPFPKATAHKN